MDLATYPKATCVEIMMWRVTLAFAIAVMLSRDTIAQQPPSQVSFEVASVKPNKSGERGGNMRRQPGGRVSAVNMPLNTLITFAYQVRLFTLAGAPGWIADERFDILAKLDGDPPPVPPGSGPDPLMLVMRTLLADRFKLRFHRETRDTDIYSLVLARPAGKPGPGLKPSMQDCSPTGIEARRAGAPAVPSGGTASVICGMQMAPGRIGFGGFPLSTFANGLVGQVGRVVVDRTGLNGNWDLPVGPIPPARTAT